MPSFSPADAAAHDRDKGADREKAAGREKGADREKDVYYVAPGGVDDPRAGAAGRPFASISFAAKRVPDGSTILVKPGTYNGRVGIDKQYEKGITIRSEVPYRAVLRNKDKVIFCYGCAGVTFEGFDVAHNGPGAGAVVVQIDGGGEDGRDGGRIVLRNNVLHDAYNNDILKVNNGARDITVTGNVFYNQAGRDEHIDANSVENVTIEDNIFFNDFEGSGRAPEKEAASYVLVKDSNENDDKILGSKNVLIRRNVFLGWQGGRAYGFLLLGEDGKAYYEATNVLVENNLFLGDSKQEMRSPFGVKGARDATFRHNTIVGDLPGKAFATRLNREGSNNACEEIKFYNNVWADPTGTMSKFSDTATGDVSTFALANNLYWNGGKPIPSSRDNMINADHDRARIVANPALPDPSGVVRPRWVPERGAFADGSKTIEAARLAIAEKYARPAGRSALVDKADGRNAAKDDIRGRPRTGRPDIGAFEVDAALPARAASREK